MNLDHERLKYLLSFYSKKELAPMLGISLPTLRRYLRGLEPLSESSVESINRNIDKLMPKRAHQHPEWRQP